MLKVASIPSNQFQSNYLANKLKLPGLQLSTLESKMSHSDQRSLQTLNSIKASP